MRVALAVVVMGGLLYLEALHGWVVHRVERLDAALRQMRYATEDWMQSAAALGSSLRDLEESLSLITVMVRARNK